MSVSGVSNQQNEYLLLAQQYGGEEAAEAASQVLKDYENFKTAHPHIITGLYSAYNTISVALDSLGMYNTARLLSLNPAAAAITGASSSICEKVITYTLPYIQSSESPKSTQVKVAEWAIIHLSSLAVGTLVANAANYPITFGSVMLIELTSQMIGILTLLGVSLTLAAVGGTIYYFYSSENNNKIKQ